MLAGDSDSLPSGAARRIIEDVTCLACGCLCDDVRVAVENDRVVAVERACERGRASFLRETIAGPGCTIDGEPAAFEAAVERAAEILVAARYPLVCGLRDVSCEAQCRAVALADWLGAVVDPTCQAADADTMLAFQTVGEVTCTWGEVRHRGDLIIFWGFDPSDTHPRLVEKYIAPSGRFVPGGRADRTCVVVDSRPNRMAADADVSLSLTPGSDEDALTVLRMLIHGLPIEEAEVAARTGVRLDVWHDLAQRMRQARFGVVLFDHRHGSAEALFRLVRELNAHARFVCLPVAERGNRSGAEQVLAWRTGYPLAVNFARGYPRYSPGEYSAAAVLSRGEADAALVVGGDFPTTLEPAAQLHLASIPQIVLSPEPVAGAAVMFRTAATGLASGGTVYRGDGIPLPLRPPLPATLPPDAQVLTAIEARVRQRQSG
jgi:formylmethanofuran dehydrogenase subunit B